MIPLLFYDNFLPDPDLDPDFLTESGFGSGKKGFGSGKKGFGSDRIHNTVYSISTGI
jgi:hypothetical protein